VIVACEAGSDVAVVEMINSLARARAISHLVTHDGRGPQIYVSSPTATMADRIAARLAPRSRLARGVRREQQDALVRVAHLYQRLPRPVTQRSSVLRHSHLRQIDSMPRYTARDRRVVDLRTLRRRYLPLNCMAGWSTPLGSATRRIRELIAHRGPSPRPS
jgi:hypothetical protein